MTQGYLLVEYLAEGRLRLGRALAQKAQADRFDTTPSEASPSAADAVTKTVDENTVAAARMHSAESSQDIAKRLLIAFGGSGPLHATRVARCAGVQRVLIPTGPGAGSALGFLHAPVSFETIRSCYMTLSDFHAAPINKVFREMQSEAEQVVRTDASDAALLARCVAIVRYKGQRHEIDI